MWSFCLLIVKWRDMMLVSWHRKKLAPPLWEILDPPLSMDHVYDWWSQWCSDRLLIACNGGHQSYGWFHKDQRCASHNSDFAHMILIRSTGLLVDILSAVTQLRPPWQPWLASGIFHSLTARLSSCGLHTNQYKIVYHSRKVNWYMCWIVD